MLNRLLKKVTNRSNSSQQNSTASSIQEPPRNSSNQEKAMNEEAKREEAKFVYDLNEFPDDALEEIFLRVSGKDLNKNVGLVCKKWHDLIENNHFWVQKCIKDKRLTQEKLDLLHKLVEREFNPKVFYFSYFDLFEKNYLKNPCGNERFDHWCFCRQLNLRQNITDLNENILKQIVEFYDANKSKIIREDEQWWRIEEEDCGTEPLHDEDGKIINKFATSYSMGEKYQVVDLNKECKGVDFLVKLNAKIEVSEMYAPRFDCGCRYYLKVYLLDDAFSLVDSFVFEDSFPQWSPTVWKKASHVFDVKKKIRYIIFYHAGTDTQYWAGFYGSKMSSGSIRIHI